jgi:hypothetical protein
MKVLITIQGDDVAPRFDLATEVLIAVAEEGRVRGEPRTILLSGPSGEEICGLIVKEEIALVICGGIEEIHSEYLTWKKVRIIDQVIGPHKSALNLAQDERLEPGSILEGSGAARHE